MTSGYESAAVTVSSSPARPTTGEHERVLRCVKCGVLEIACEPQGRFLDPDDHVCASCLHATIRLEYGELPWGY